MSTVQVVSAILCRDFIQAGATPEIRREKLKYRNIIIAQSTNQKKKGEKNTHARARSPPPTLTTHIHTYTHTHNHPNWTDSAVVGKIG